MRRAFRALAIALAAVCSPLDASAWNETGHHVLARIAWDHMTPEARRQAVERLMAAPADACLLDLFDRNASRPLDERQREFVLRASTWPDIVRPRGDADSRPCTRFHRRDWHFINYFWEGVSGATNQDRPRDRTRPATPELNAVERLGILRPLVVCVAPACGTSAADRATWLAWILHIVGDIHQPLHTTSRVTTRAGEQEGDLGGNLFALDSPPMPLSLHAYWDGIIDRAVPRQANEKGNDRAYVTRVAATIAATHPHTSMAARLKPGDFEAWAREGLAVTKQHVYPATLARGQMPSADYRANAARVAFEAIALGGYRLADLLNRMLG